MSMAGWAMPQSSDEMRTKWGGYMGVGEDKALGFLLECGWRQVGNGLMRPPEGQRPAKEWEAMQFLVEEWDFAVAE